MKKSFVYLLLVGVSVYFSFVAGNILASLEGEKSESEEISYNSMGGPTSSGKSFSDYFIPGSSYLSDENSGSSGAGYIKNHSIRETSSQKTGSYMPKFNLFPQSENSSERAGGSGGGYSPQGITVIRGKKRNDDPLVNDGIGGNLAPVFWGGGGSLGGSSISSLSTRGSANATGSFGTNARLSLPGEEFETLAPVPEVTPIPLDNGSIALIIGGLIVGAYFILKDSALLGRISKSTE